MREQTCTRLAIALFLTAGSGAVGQMVSGINTESILTIGVTGTATAPADWVDVNLTVKGEGVNLQEALAASNIACQGTIQELAALGIAEENVGIGAPSLASADFAQMMAGMAGDAPAEPMRSVARSLTVRFTIVDRDTVWEDVFLIVDVATAGGASPAGGEGPNPLMPQMMTSGEPFTFGVDDTEALRTQAIANGLQDAKKQADAVAASAGKGVKGLSAVSLQEYQANPMMAMMTMVGAKPTAGQASYQIGLIVTYELE